MYRTLVTLSLILLMVPLIALHADQDDTAVLKDAFEEVVEYSLFKKLTDLTGKDYSIWYVIFKVVNAIPGDSARHTPKFQAPRYKGLSDSKLQERLGFYIVAKQEVEKMPPTEGRDASIRALQEEIDRMRAEVLRRHPPGK